MTQPFLVQYPEASVDIKKCFGSIYVPGYETVFDFPSSLGDFVSTGIAANDEFTSVLDGAPVVRTYNNFTVNAGHLVTVANRCKGLYLNIRGDLIVNGTLSMTARGASGAGKCVVIDKQSSKVYYFATLNEVTTANWYTAEPARYTVIPPTGGLGKVSTSALPYPVIDPNGACGAGGSTAGVEIHTAFTSVRGGNGTSFSGGAGAGGGTTYHVDGVSYDYYANGAVGSDNGGAGGAGAVGRGPQGSKGGGGGAGNPGGVCSQQTTRNGTSGTGGLMILFVLGNVILGTSGSIQANGSAGGNGYYAAGSYPSWAGAGSGGGAVHMFYKKDINTPAKISANGGAAGTSSYVPTAPRVAIACPGGNGTINLVKI